MKIAVCIGHSRIGDNGAESVGGVDEWHFNEQVGRLVVEILAQWKLEAVLIAKYEGRGYSAAMTWVANRLREIGAGVAVELHFNADDNPAANGSEFLYWGSSPRGKRLAMCLNYAFGGSDFKARGIKARGGSDRGAEYLRKTPCPAVICEPFFGTNPQDWRIAKENPRDIAICIARGLKSYVETNS